MTALHDHQVVLLALGIQIADGFFNGVTQFEVLAIPEAVFLARVKFGLGVRAERLVLELADAVKHAMDFGCARVVVAVVLLVPFGPAVVVFLVEEAALLCVAFRQFVVAAALLLGVPRGQHLAVLLVHVEAVEAGEVAAFALVFVLAVSDELAVQLVQDTFVEHVRGLHVDVFDVGLLGELGDVRTLVGAELGGVDGERVSAVLNVVLVFVDFDVIALTGTHTRARVALEPLHALDVEAVHGAGLLGVLGLLLGQGFVHTQLVVDVVVASGRTLLQFVQDFVVRVGVFECVALGVHDQFLGLLGRTAALDFAGLPESVDGFVGVLFGGRNLRDHGGLAVLPDEALAQHQSEFALPLVDIVFVCVQGSNAFLQR
mmetsp:Transcript_15363/g.33626  ORF Transcript_15363/g.33626 Transcript_15363/m.33626 type:complete len:373 (-) Transcript_15363:837-1955(-)